MSVTNEGQPIPLQPDRQRIIATPEEATSVLADMHKRFFTIETVATELNAYKAKYPNKSERLFGRMPPFDSHHHLRNSYAHDHEDPEKDDLYIRMRDRYNLTLKRKDERAEEWDDEWRELSQGKNRIDTVQVKTKSLAKQKGIRRIAESTGVAVVFMPEDNEDGETFWQRKSKEEGWDLLGDDISSTWHLALKKARHPFMGFNTPFAIPRLGMDTTIWNQAMKRAYNKPGQYEHAYNELLDLSGQAIHVITASVLEMITKSGEPISYPAGYAMKLKLKQFTPQAVEKYLAENERYQSANAGLDLSHPSGQELVDPATPIQFLPISLGVNTLQEPFRFDLPYYLARDSVQFSVDTLPAFTDYFQGVDTDLFRSEFTNLNNIYQSL